MAKQQPIDEVRIGAVKAAIWKNETDPRKGGTRFNVTFQRLYRDNGNWKSAESFGRDDLLVLAKVADAAHTRIYDLQQQDD